VWCIPACASVPGARLLGLGLSHEMPQSSSVMTCTGVTARFACTGLSAGPHQYHISAISVPGLLLCGTHVTA
jgi:hypothetical protein